MNNMKKLIFAAILLCMVLTLAINAEPHWADEYITEAAANGWLSYDFHPDDIITREKLSIMIWYALEKPKADLPCPFTDIDVNNPEIYAAISAVYELGILKGYSETEFAPDDHVTREMGFTILQRAFSLTAKDETLYTKFDDSADISNWATDAISAMTESGYLQGTGNNLCEPQKTMTYGEFIKLLTLLYENHPRIHTIHHVNGMITDIPFPEPGVPKPGELIISDDAKFTASLEWGEDGFTYGILDGQYHSFTVTLTPVKGYTFKDSLIYTNGMYSTFRNAAPLVEIISRPNEDELRLQLTYYVFRYRDDNDFYLLQQTLLRMNLVNNFKFVSDLDCMWEDGKLVRISWNEKNLKGNIDLSGFKSLKELFIRSNEIISLNINGCESLEFLDCTDNQIEELFFEGCDNIEIFYANWNRLSKLDVSNLKSLWDIRCNRNQITKLNVTGCGNIEVLQCGENQLTELNLKGLKKLRSLYTKYNQITELDLRGCVSLASADVDCDDSVNVIFN